jgi:hypothetical protein
VRRRVSSLILVPQQEERTDAEGDDAEHERRLVDDRVGTREQMERESERERHRDQEPADRESGGGRRGAGGSTRSDADRGQQAQA